jgi:hypothetical protein
MKEYSIIEKSSRDLLQEAINSLLTKSYANGDEVTVLGGVAVEVYPGFPPSYLQAILIERNIKEQSKLLLENFGIFPNDSKDVQIPTIWNEPTTIEPLKYENTISNVNPANVTTYIPPTGFGSTFSNEQEMIKQIGKKYKGKK